MIFCSGICVSVTFILPVCVFVQSTGLTKPNWTLRIVTDESTSESIKVKRDTEKTNQIDNIKATWEKDKPGRSVKVCQRKYHYIFSFHNKTEANWKQLRDLYSYSTLLFALF